MIVVPAVCTLTLTKHCSTTHPDLMQFCAHAAALLLLLPHLPNALLPLAQVCPGLFCQQPCSKQPRQCLLGTQVMHYGLICIISFKKLWFPPAFFVDTQTSWLSYCKPFECQKYMFYLCNFVLTVVLVYFWQSRTAKIVKTCIEMTMKVQ